VREERYKHADTATYADYDRWCDDWNVCIEGSTTDTARSPAGIAWLASQTSPAAQAWTSTNAAIRVPPGLRLLNQPLTVNLSVADPNLAGARIVWEANGQEPTFGTQAYTFTPGPTNGSYWIEAEVQWPDGRRAFATNSVTVNLNAPAELSAPQHPAGGFSFQLAGVPFVAYVVEVSTDLKSWTPLVTNTLQATAC
jgi:hypothetical protein